MSINPHLFPSGITLAINLLQQKIDKLKSLPIVIAIDGNSSSGKSTLAKDLAKLLNFKYLDSGAMYRAVTLYFIENQIDIHDSGSLEKAINNIHIDLKSHKGENHIFLNNRLVDEEIRSMAVASMVSEVAALSRVRRFLVKQQQAMGKSKKVIMDGRDIGTVVFPNAEIKIFLTASIDERTTRRYEELRRKNVKTTKEDVRKNLVKRDKIDSTRKDSPLKKADDAIVLDTSDMNRTEQFQEVLKSIIEKLKI